jgi:hypothetical protein
MMSHGSPSEAVLIYVSPPTRFYGTSLPSGPSRVTRGAGILGSAFNRRLLNFYPLGFFQAPSYIYASMRAAVYLRYDFSSFFLSLSLYDSTALLTLAGFQFLNPYTVGGLLGRGISPSQGRYLHTEQHKQNKRTQTSMPRVGFVHTTPMFERAKMVHTLDRAATVIGGILVK